MNNENMSAAERIIQALLGHQDHMVHNRPGIVTQVAGQVKWEPCTHKDENGQRVVYKLVKQGKKNARVRLGHLFGQPLMHNRVQYHNPVMNGGSVVAEYRPAGLFPEIATAMYQQVAEVWKLDNEFSARWASYAFGQEHRDLKVVLAAFMLCQSRKGDPVMQDGKKAFDDEDYRDVGEAMLLLTRKDGKDFNPKLLLRVYEVLQLPGVAAINRQLGFGQSTRTAFTGRWNKAVHKYLQYREENKRMLEGLVKAGFRETLISLARISGYKPETPYFFEVLRWKQSQAKDGRRGMAIGQAVKAAETWEGLSEREVCERIMAEKPGFKVITTKLPKGVGLTRAVMAAAVEAGSIGDKDLIILTPTLEELGLLTVDDVRTKWERAIKKADDMRAANIATRVKSKETQDKLQAGAEAVAQKKVEEVMKDLVVWVLVDISGSMHDSIAYAKALLKKFVHAFPADKLFVAVFNQSGRTVVIKHRSEAGVEHAFAGIAAGGGTSYEAGYMWAAAAMPPKPEQDLLVIWVGDERNHDEHNRSFANYVRGTQVLPVAFGLLKVGGTVNDRAVRTTAGELEIPCFELDDKAFADPYAIPRTLRNLVAATPVKQAPMAAPALRQRRATLAEQIMKTDLLQKPAWAA